MEAGNITRSDSIELGVLGGATVTETATYDALGRMLTSTDGLSNTHQYFYDARHQVTRAVDPEGYATEMQYDDLDRMTQRTQPEGISVTYSWDKASRMTGYLDALGNQTTWAYDAVNRRTFTTYPDAGTLSFTYDAASNLTQRIDQRGVVMAQTFDAANRPMTRSVSGPVGLEGPLSESFTYDELNRLTQAQSGSVVTVLEYDSLSRLVSDTTNGRQVTYQHDLAGNTLLTSYPSAYQFSASFDPFDRPLTIAQAGAAGTLATYGYRGPFLVQTKTQQGPLRKLAKLFARFIEEQHISNKDHGVVE